MSQSGDDYRSANQLPSPDLRNDTEPADPEYINHDTRRNTPIGPPSTSVADIPDPLVEGTGKDARLPTVGEAQDTYMRIQRASWNSDDRYSAYERHCNETYPRLCKADRQLRKRYDDVTTVMVTRRLSPIGDDGQWMPPLEIDKQLHDKSAWRAVRRQFRRTLDEYSFEYIAVTAPTETAATPHQHIYLYIDDPDDLISPDDFVPAIEKHLKHCPNAYEDDHRHSVADGSGAITVRHNPDLTDHDKSNESITIGCQYIVSQLPHMHLVDYYDDQKDNPETALFEGAAVAWASSHQWFRASSGVPKLDDDKDGG